ncbi:unnamed protein product [Effrenium voratum]|nr:unnamed protein product [Effrenium voratum]
MAWRCSNEQCTYLASSNTEKMGTFCCKRCHWIHCGGRSKKLLHGNQCKKLPAPPDAVRAPNEQQPTDPIVVEEVNSAPSKKQYKETKPKKRAWDLEELSTKPRSIWRNPIEPKEDGSTPRTAGKGASARKADAAHRHGSVARFLQGKKRPSPESTRRSRSPIPRDAYRSGKGERSPLARRDGRRRSRSDSRGVARGSAGASAASTAVVRAEASESALGLWEDGDSDSYTYTEGSVHLCTEPATDSEPEPATRSWTTKSKAKARKAKGSASTRPPKRSKAPAEVAKPEPEAVDRSSQEASGKTEGSSPSSSSSN